MTDQDVRRYAEAKVIEISIDEFRKNPHNTFEATRQGLRVIVRDIDGSIFMRMSPEFDD